MLSISSKALGFPEPENGLESVLSDPVVKRYMEANQLRAGTLMPGWDTWDKPHLWNMLNGGITPTHPEMLVEQAQAWDAEQKKAAEALAR